jgi:hypothetical protein
MFVSCACARFVEACVYRSQMHLAAGRNGSNISLAGTEGKKNVFSFLLIGSSGVNGNAIHFTHKRNFSRRVSFAFKTRRLYCCVKFYNVM